MRRRRIIARSVLAATVLLAGTELVLQLAHVLVSRQRARQAVSEPTSPVILCVGDSHTYGAGVEVEEAYPAQLEKLLRRQGLRVNVINLGAPGMNTSEIRRRLPQWLERFSPLAVIILAGVNNGWNHKDAFFSDAADGRKAPILPRVWDFLSTRVRLLRLAVVLVHRLEWAGPAEELARTRTGEIILHFRPEPPELEAKEAIYDRARRDLIAIIATARAGHALPVFLTYVTDPQYTFETPNHLLREIARFMNVPLADTDRALRPLFQNPDGSINLARRTQLFFPDMHPRPAAYEKMAAVITETLGETGVLALLSQDQSRE